MTRLRTILLFPTALCLLLWAAYAFAVGLDSPIAAAVPLVVLVALLVASALDVEFFLQRPLRRLKLAVQGLARDGSAAASGPTELRVLAAEIERLQTRTRESETRLAEASAHRHSLEASLRELEDRYALTVERANDGTWEWDIRSSVTRFSPRWKGMLGYLDSPLASIDDWQRLLHPDDRDAVIDAARQPRAGADAALRGGVPPAARRWQLPLGAFARHRDPPRERHAVSVAGHGQRHPRTQRARGHAHSGRRRALVGVRHGFLPGADEEPVGDPRAPATTSSATARTIRRPRHARSRITPTASSGRTSSTLSSALRAARSSSARRSSTAPPGCAISGRTRSNTTATATSACRCSIPPAKSSATSPAWTATQCARISRTWHFSRSSRCVRRPSWSARC